MNGRRPGRDEIQAAAGKGVPDIIASRLKILFCGINPGLYSAAIGHNFGRPGNRFWRTLHLAGLTDRLLSPWEENELPSYGLGITNFVDRATAGAAELSAAELQKGAARLQEKILQYVPSCVAVLGVNAYRSAFGNNKAAIGLQLEKIGETIFWLLPNPSGLNAHYQLPDLVKHFRKLRQFVFREKSFRIKYRH